MKINSLCKFTCPEEHWKMYPFTSDNTFVYLGDIAQMPGHGVFVEFYTGKMYVGYHTDNFVAKPDEEC